MGRVNRSLAPSSTLKTAIEFHGHLGPYLVLGLLMGELALKEARARKYFGMDISVSGVTKRPKSCLVDGLQISTGCTYGKGNIRKEKGKAIRAVFRNLDNGRKTIIGLQDGLIIQLDGLSGHKDSGLLAARLIKAKPGELFKVNKS